MINTHTDIVKAIENFCEKNEFINDFLYVDNVTDLVAVSNLLVPRSLVLALDTLLPDDKEYNYQLTYSFTITEKTQYDDDSILLAESTNMFCIIALNQYLNKVIGAEVSFETTDFVTESDADAFCSCTGRFVFNLKTNPALWSRLTSY